MKIDKYDILIVDLEPTKGSEQKGVRPCLVVQNNESNRRSNTVVVCSFTSVLKKYPHMMEVEPSEENGLCVTSRLDTLQIRTIDKIRIYRRIGYLDKKYHALFRSCFEIAYDLDDLL